MNELNELDWKILAALMNDGRASNVEIARQVNSSETTVRRRIQSLIDNGIMQIVAMTDPSRIGLQAQIVVGVTVELSQIHEVVQQLVALQSVTYLAYTIGPFDLLLQAYFPTNSREDLFAFLTDELASIPGIVSTQTLTVLKVAKRTWDFQLASPEIRRWALELSRNDGQSGNGDTQA